MIGGKLFTAVTSVYKTAGLVGDHWISWPLIIFEPDDHLLFIVDFSLLSLGQLRSWYLSVRELRGYSIQIIGKGKYSACATVSIISCVIVQKAQWKSHSKFRVNLFHNHLVVWIFAVLRYGKSTEIPLWIFWTIEPIRNCCYLVFISQRHLKVCFWFAVFAHSLIRFKDFTKKDIQIHINF